MSPPPEDPSGADHHKKRSSRAKGGRAKVKDAAEGGGATEA